MRVKTARPPFTMHRVCSAFARLYKTYPKSVAVRKFLAILMVFVFGAFYAAPLLKAASNDPDAGLPACCRHNGKHHCAMMDEYLKPLDARTPQFRATPQHCPLYPHSTTAPVVRYHAGLMPSAAFLANIVSHPAVQPQVRAVYRLSLDRSRQKRGPPAQLLSI
jgi:hypothetical protein